MYPYVTAHKSRIRLNFFYSMKNKIVFIFICAFFLTSKAKGNIVLVDPYRQLADEYNSLVVADGIREIYGDSVFYKHVSQIKNGAVQLFISKELTIDSIGFLKRYDAHNYLYDDMTKWYKLVDYIKSHTICYYQGAYHPPFPLTRLLIFTGITGVFNSYIDFKLKYPDKIKFLDRSEMNFTGVIDLYNYVSDYFKTYKFDLYEYNGDNLVITKKYVVLYNH